MVRRNSARSCLRSAYRETGADVDVEDGRLGELLLLLVASMGIVIGVLEVAHTGSRENATGSDEFMKARSSGRHGQR